MTQRDLAGLLHINVKTLRKWKKDRPQVYELLLIGLEVKNILARLKADCAELETMLETSAEISRDERLKISPPPPQATNRTRLKNDDEFE